MTDSEELMDEILDNMVKVLEDLKKRIEVLENGKQQPNT